MEPQANLRIAWHCGVLVRDGLGFRIWGLRLGEDYYKVDSEKLPHHSHVTSLRDPNSSSVTQSCSDSSRVPSDSKVTMAWKFRVWGLGFRAPR